MKFNLKGLTAYQMKLIRFALKDLCDQLVDLIEEVDLSNQELTSTARELRTARKLVSLITSLLDTKQ